MIKYIKSVLWIAAKLLSYIQDVRCLKVNGLSDVPFSSQYEKTAALCSVVLMFKADVTPGGGGGGRGAVQITGAWRFGRWRGSISCCICWCFALLYHYSATVQINPSRPSPSHSATDTQFFLFRVKSLSLSALDGPHEKKFSTRARTHSRRPCCCTKT